MREILPWSNFCRVPKAMHWLCSEYYCETIVWGSSCVLSAGNLSCNVGLQPAANTDTWSCCFVCLSWDINNPYLSSVSFWKSFSLLSLQQTVLQPTEKSKIRSSKWLGWVLVGGFSPGPEVSSGSWQGVGTSPGLGRTSRDHCGVFKNSFLWDRQG